MTREHYKKYEALAQQIGMGQLRLLVAGIADDAHIRECLTSDEHLNNIPLGKWDARDAVVRRAAAAAGIHSWSLGHTVCVLKHVARHHVAGWRRP